MTKKHVSLLVVFVLLFTTLFSSFVFAADDEWVVADEITINVKAHIQTHGDKVYSDKGMIAFGTFGEAKRLEEFTITLDGAPEGMELRAMAHVQSFGDTPATGLKAGTVGTHGLAKRIEGVAFGLYKEGTDTLYPGYRVKYAVHMQSFGWGVSKDVNDVVGKNFKEYDSMVVGPDFAGTKGLSKRIESVSLIIEKEAKFEVKSVTANNLKQIFVEFNKAVDKDTAEDEGNYKVGKKDTLDLTGAVAELQEDGKTVVITLANGKEADQQETIDLTIKNVKDTLGKALPETTVEDIEFLDTTLPKALSAEVIGNDTIKVTFSEPMRSNGADPVVKGDFKVDDGDYTIKEISFSKNDTEVNIEVYSTFEEGELTVEVTSGAEDYAGFGALKKVFKVDVVEDKEAPEVVGYKDATPRGITLIFNEDIEVLDGDMDNFYHTNSRNPVDSDVDQADVDGNELTLSFTDNNLPKGTAYIYILDDAVGDLWDNKNDQIMVKVEVSVDTTKPTVKEIEVTDGRQDQIVVTFSEKVDEETAEEEDNYTLLDSDGDEVKNIIDSIVWDSADEDNVTITFEKDLNGEYSLVIENVEDLAGNEIADTTEKFAVGDEKAPSFADFKATLYKKGVDGQMLKITFGEAMATTGKYSVDDLEKYVLVKTGQNDIVLADLKNDAAADIDVVDGGKAVEISIPANTTENTDGHDIDGSWDVAMARVADAAGNYTTRMSGTIDIVESGTIGYEVKATDSKTVVVTFEKFVDDLKLSDLEIVINSSVVNPAKQVKGKNSDGKSTITYTLLDADKMTSDAKSTSNSAVAVRVTTTPASVNAYGEGLLSGDSVNAVDKIAPALVKYTVGGVNNVKKVVADDFTVKLYFEEAINPNTLSSKTFTVEDYTIESVTVDPSDSKIVVITLKDKAIKPEVKDDVALKVAIEDAAGNALSSLDVEVAEFTDNTAPVVITKLPVATTITAIGTHSLVFNEKLSDSSRADVKAAVESAYTVNSGASLSTEWNAAGTTLKVTFNATSANTIVLGSIADQTVTDMVGKTSTVEVQ